MPNMGVKIKEDCRGCCTGFLKEWYVFQDPDPDVDLPASSGGTVSTFFKYEKMKIFLVFLKTFSAYLYKYFFQTTRRTYYHQN